MWLGPLGHTAAGRLPATLSYDRLARAIELYAGATVDCMTCLTVIARSP
jgi:hypothetical protein